MEWISIGDKLPDAGVMVLAYYKNSFGKHRRIRAFYAPEQSIEDTSDDDDICDYDEEQNVYWLREGWFESNEAEEYFYSVDGKISHWMPLPEPPLLI